MPVFFQIYGTRDQGECSSPNDIVVNIHQWGVGANITTKLINPNNEVEYSSGGRSLSLMTATTPTPPTQPAGRITAPQADG